MSKAIDELKELEARRAAVVADIKAKTNHPYTIALAEQSFDRRNKHTYRRLALEVAAKYEEELNLSEAKSQIINALNDVKYPSIIFSPSDPRVVVGQEYEFSHRFDFNNDGHGVGEDDIIIGTLVDVSYSYSPFSCTDSEGNNWGNFVFIRHIQSVKAPGHLDPYDIGG